MLLVLCVLSLYCLPCNGRSIVCTQELTYFLCIPHSRSHIALKHSHNNNDTRCTSITLFIRIQAKLVTLVARLMDQINRKLRSLFTMSFSKNIVVRQCDAVPTAATLLIMIILPQVQSAIRMSRLVAFNISIGTFICYWC